MALPDFVELGPHIFLHTPPEHQVGQLIILCTWMGAADKHVEKYTEIWRQNAPRAKILLLRSVVKSMISSYASQERAMKPAQDAICQVLDECSSLQPAAEGTNVKPAAEDSNEKPGSEGTNVKPAADGSNVEPGAEDSNEKPGAEVSNEKPVAEGSNEKPPARILLHMMSNGGANSATNLLVGLERRRKTNLPLVGMVCDSTPNASSFKKTCNAFMHSFPSSFPINLIAMVFVYFTITLLYLWIAVGNEPPEDYWRRSILDDKLIGCNKVFYIASKIDKLTDWNDVVSHAEEARKKGWAVKEVIVDDTPHCNHLSKHREVYIDSVSDVWEGREIC